MLYLRRKLASDGKSIREIKQRKALEKTAFSKKHKPYTLKKIHPISRRDSLKHVYGVSQHINLKHGS